MVGSERSSVTKAAPLVTDVSQPAAYVMDMEFGVVGTIFAAINNVPQV